MIISEQPPQANLSKGMRQLSKLTKTKRDTRIVQAVHRYGYSQSEIADYVELHYATISRLANSFDTIHKT